LIKSSNMHVSKMMAQHLGVPFLGNGKFHYFKVGKERYTLYTTHGSTGARLPHTKIRGCLDLAKFGEAEIYAMGHVHSLQHLVRPYYSPNLRKRTIDTKHKHFVTTGSFLNHWGSYAHRNNYEPMPIGSPVIKFDGDKHQIRVIIGARDEQKDYSKKPNKRTVA